MKACLSSSATTTICGMSSENTQRPSTSHLIKASWSLHNIHLRHLTFQMALRESGLQLSILWQSPKENHSTNSICGFTLRKENVMQSFLSCFLTTVERGWRRVQAKGTAVGWTLNGGMVVASYVNLKQWCPSTSEKSNEQLLGRQQVSRYGIQG